MSTLRRTSTKQGLQDLLWVTAQRRMEDAEEIEREQRRRARRTQSCEITCSSPSLTNPNQNHGLPLDNAVSETNPKPNCQVALEEDEGFSDWAQRLEKRKQRQQEEQEYQDDHRPKHNESSKTNQITNHNEEEEQNHGKTEKKSQRKISFTSKVYMPHDMRHLNTNGELTDRTSCLVAGTISPGCSSNLSDHSGVGGEGEDAFLETEQRSEMTRQSHARKKELKEQKYLQEQQEQDEQYKLKEENDQRRDEEEQHRQIQEEEERLRMRENVERRKMKTTEEQMKTLCISCNEGEPISSFCPMGPTFKKLLIQFYPKEMEGRMTADSTCTITEQTETLNCSLQKKNILKKAPPVVVFGIDNRLEQYTHAIETASKEVNATKQVLTDLPSPTEAVATKKNLFEAGEAWSQNVNKATLSKETDDLKVGIVDIITQLVNGISDGDRKSSTIKPAEIKPGDVLNKKNLWENLGDRSSSGMIRKGIATNKKYKFVVKGHGKYEKKAANFRNEKSEGLSNEDL